MSSISPPRRMSELGPEWDIAWVEGPRSRAKQLETLQIDVEFALDWVNTMAALVDRDLDDQEFTLQRMAALHDWERRRKRAQKNLHYKFDPFRRKKRLVERDVAKILADAQRTIAIRRERLEAEAERLTPRLAVDEQTEAVREKLAVIKSRMDQHKPTAPRDHPPSPKRRASVRRSADTLPAPVDRSAIIEQLSDDVRDNYSNFTELDLATAPDDDIRDALKSKGIDERAAQYIIDVLNGQQEPPSW